jgi:hypothetical protein
MNFQVYYPLTFAHTFPEVPSEVTVRSFIEAFRTRVHPSMPFLSQIPLQSFCAANMPEYMTYAMAAVGAVKGMTDSSTSHALWSTANILIASTLEVDNREARKVDLINAV